MHALTVRLRERWRDASLVDAGWLLAFAVLFWASKWGGKVIDGVPGHSGAFWIPVLFLSRGTLGRPGAATVTALLGALLWTFPKGTGFGGLAPYVMAGLTLDLLGVNAQRLRHLPWALLTGMLVHLAKFGFHNIPLAVLGVPADFMALGMWPVLALHLGFGLLGGFIGWLLLRRIRPEEGRM